MGFLNALRRVAVPGQGEVDDELRRLQEERGWDNQPGIGSSASGGSNLRLVDNSAQSDPNTARSFQRAEYPESTDLPPSRNVALPGPSPGQVLTPANQAAITRPRTVDPSQQELAPTSTPQPATISSTGQVNDAQSIRERTVGPRVIYNNKGRPVSVEGGPDPVAANEALIREQEDYKAPRSTKDQVLAFLTGGIPGGIDYATNQHTRDQWATRQDISSEEGQIQRELGVQGRQATIAATKWRPVYQQGAQNEREINDALSQYNRLETYDPEDPARAGLTSYFRSHGINLPAKDKYHRPTATWANGQLLLTDQQGTRNATVNGQNVTDIGRTPNEGGLTPNQQAAITARTNEGQKNRDARKVNVDAIIKAVGGRQDKQIASTIAQMGDPQEMYGAASDLWQQATDAESQAGSMEIKTTADADTKKQLLANAAKLKETTVKIQQEARKASSGQRATGGGASQSRGGRDGAAAVPGPYAGKPWSLGQWNTKNSNATAQQRAAAVAKARNAQMKIID